MSVQHEKMCPVAECGKMVNTDNWVEHLAAYKVRTAGIMLEGNVPLSESHERWAAYNYANTWNAGGDIDGKWKDIMEQFNPPPSLIGRIKAKMPGKWMKGANARCRICGGKITKMEWSGNKSGSNMHAQCKKNAEFALSGRRRSTLKALGIGAAIAGAAAMGVQGIARATSGSTTETQISAQGIVLPSLTEDPSTPEPGQMWYRSDRGVNAFYDGIAATPRYSNRDHHELTVSGHGIANGLSTILNDGADFGIDTHDVYNSLGIQPAILALQAIGHGTIRLKNGPFIISNPVLTEDPNNAGTYAAIFIPLNATIGTDTEPDNVYNIVSDTFTRNEITQSSPVGNYIQIQTTTTNTFWAFYVMKGTNATFGYMNNVSVNLDNFWAVVPGISNANGVSLQYANVKRSGAIIVFNEVLLTNSAPVSTDAAGTGVWIGNYQYEAEGQLFRNINVVGFSTGVFLSGHDTILEYTTAYVGVGVMLDTDDRYWACIIDWDYQLTSIMIQVSSTTSIGNIRAGMVRWGDQTTTAGDLGVLTWLVYVEASHTLRVDGNLWNQDTTVALPAIFNNGTIIGGMHHLFDGASRAPAAVTVGASVFTYANSGVFYGEVTVGGGVVTGIALNGIATGMTSGVFTLHASDSIAVTYTTAPTMTARDV